MTEKERDRQITDIKASNTPLPVKAKRIGEVQQAYRESQIVDNGRGQSVTRADWDEMRFAERNAFVHGDEMDRVRFDAFDSVGGHI